MIESDRIPEDGYLNEPTSPHSIKVLGKKPRPRKSLENDVAESWNWMVK
jgi:hypothetical protein